MSGLSQQECLLREGHRCELAQRRIDRREFITRSLVTGLGLAGVGAVAKSGIGRAFAVSGEVNGSKRPQRPAHASLLHGGLEWRVGALMRYLFLKRRGGIWPARTRAFG
jgi:hypothetical protein